MALDKFRAAPLPNPPAQYDAQYLRQLVRVLENYFSQLDSRTPNNAEQYSANRFVGGSFSGSDITANSINTTALDSISGNINNLETDVTQSVYTDTDSLHTHTAQITTLMTDATYGGRFYGDGRWIETPYNQFWSDADQTTASVANANALTLNQNDFPNGISIASSSQITFADEGLYLITYSIQLRNTTNDVQDVDIWFRRNGTNIANSNSRFSLPARKSSGSASHLIAVTPFMVDIAAGQYVEIMWRVTDVGVDIQHFPAVTASPGVTPAIPATPSAIVAVQFISAQHPPVTRVTPLPVFGFGQIGDISVNIR